MVQASIDGFSPLAVPAGAPAQSPTGPRHHLTFHGSGGALFVLILKNVLLTLLTLGLYAAWATTARRKYVWQNLDFHGQRLVYHGTGRELFKGYVKVVLGYVVFLGVPAALRRVSPTAGAVVQVAFGLGMLALIPFAIYWSRAYLLSRTTWRGVRFSMQPGAGPFARTFVVGYLLTLLTLGLYGPIWMNRLRAVSVNRTRLGNEHFRYDGSDREVWKLSIKGFVLSLVTLGVYYFWFAAELARYQLSHTHFQGASVRLELTGWEACKLTLIYLLGTTFSLGLAFPWLVTYATRFVLERVSLEGPIDFSAITQSDAQGRAAGDGLADALDLGLPL